MTLEAHKNAILHALRKRGRTLEDDDETWSEIREAVASVQKFQAEHAKQTPRNKTGKERRDYYDEFHAQLDGAQTSFRKLINDAYLKEPIEQALGEWVDWDDGLGWWHVDWLSVERDLGDALKYLEELTSWVAKVRQQAQAMVVTHRPTLPATQILNKFVYSLALIYFKQTGDYPGFSNGNPAHFELFFEAVANATNFNFRPSSLKRAIKRLDPKKNLHFHQDANEPKRDYSRSSEEIFRHLINKPGQ
jgi:hypothetical protein